MMAEKDSRPVDFGEHRAAAKSAGSIASFFSREHHQEDDSPACGSPQEKVFHKNGVGNPVGNRAEANMRRQAQCREYWAVRYGERAEAASRGGVDWLGVCDG